MGLLTAKDFTLLLFILSQVWYRPIPCLVTPSFSTDSNWIKPPPSVVKVNIDGTCPRWLGSPAIGVIVRDSEGMVIVGCPKQVSCLRDASMDEALAICCGLRFVMELVFSKVILESDSKNVVLKVLQPRINQFVLRFTLMEARQVLDVNPEYCVRVIRRTANGVAHRLAQYVVAVNSPVSFTSDYPSFIASNVISDANFR
ncbi:hypothetical protein F3Y22_tig00110348pilonHSYRG00168 [Hibiscus syriacus]|uniref:RNase H type-1 domain-containing protein n=1 Tax=Hibiscus syriacus TaxID=106335 RepID=A0A6A3AZ50_HIBSY|nr:hypothetical protein F3Y22_tig00110348pilonHSYRG00168 [Hibiscus syriacus]